MVTLLVKFWNLTFVMHTCISKPELFNRQMCLVGKDTTIYSPFTVIRTTVTGACYWPTGLCACAVHSACAHVTFRCRTTPVCHFYRITWNPKAICQCRTSALVLYELFTVQGNVDKTHQLRNVRFLVVYVARVGSFAFTFVHQCPALAVVTYDSHANSAFVTHITGDVVRQQSSFTIWINQTDSTFCLRIKLL